MHAHRSVWDIFAKYRVHYIPKFSSSRIDNTIYRVPPQLSYTLLCIRSESYIPLVCCILQRWTYASQPLRPLAAMGSAVYPFFRWSRPIYMASVRYTELNPAVLC